MKGFLVLAVVLAVLPSCFAYLELVNPVGRGFSEDDNGRAPCGQSPLEVAGPRWDIYADSIQQIEVFIHAAGGGGVLFNRFSCTLNGDPRNNEEPLYPISGGLKIEIPNRPNQVYRFNIRAPPTRCVGDGTMQVVYQTYHGQTWFACTDIRVYHSHVGSASSIISNALIALIAGIFVVLALF